MKLMGLKSGVVGVACAMVVGIGASPAWGQCVPAPSGLVSWWDADSVSGTTAVDIQDANDGTMIDGVMVVPGLVGDAFSFDGSDGARVLIGDKADFEGLSQITVGAWVNTTDPTGDRGIVTKALSGNSSWILRTYFGDNSGRVSFGVSFAIVSNELQSTTSISDGQWHYVAGTYDGSMQRLYVDGVLEDTAAFSGPVIVETEHVVIGNYDFDHHSLPTWPSFNGLIDEAEVYDRALSAAEIQAIFDADSFGKCKTFDSDGDGVDDADDECPDTAAGATVDANGCTPEQGMQNVIGQLQTIADAEGCPACTPLGDKVEDALAKAQTALSELTETPPDNQAAVGAIEGAVGDLCAAVNDEGLDDPDQGTQLMDELAGVARQLAAEAIEEAIDAGGNAQDAQASLLIGDALRALAQGDCDLFKDTVKEYKNALSKAELALP